MAGKKGAGDRAFFYAYNNCMKKLSFLMLALCGLSCSFVSIARADMTAAGLDVPAAAQWLQQGLPGLALSALPEVAPDNPAWTEAENLRWRALAQLGKDAELLQRMARLPVDRQAPLAGLMAELGAPAALRQKQPKVALAMLAQGLWRGQPSALQLRAWRARVIESQLAANDARGAYTSWLRYQQDYRDAEKALAEKVIAGLVVAGLVPDALMLTARPDLSPALRSWVQLKAGVLEPAAAASGAVKQPDFWFFVLQQEAAERLKAPGLAIAAEEALLARYDGPRLQALGVSSGRLWRDYIEYALLLANEAGLLQGQDADWLALAAQLQQDNPVGQRALLAYVAARGIAVEARDAAADGLLARWRELQLLRLAPAAPDLQLSDKGRWGWGFAAYEQKQLERAGHWWSGITPQLEVNDWPAWPLARLQALQAAGQWDEARALMGSVSSESALPAEQAALVLDIAARWSQAGQAAEAGLWLKAMQGMLDGAAWREAQRLRGRLALQQQDYRGAAVAWLAAAGGSRGVEFQLAQEALRMAGLTVDADALEQQGRSGRNARK